MQIATVMERLSIAAGARSRLKDMRRYLAHGAGSGAASSYLGGLTTALLSQQAVADMQHRTASLRCGTMWMLLVTQALLGHSCLGGRVVVCRSCSVAGPAGPPMAACMWRQPCPVMFCSVPDTLAQPPLQTIRARAASAV